MSLPSTDQVSEDTLLRLEVAAKIAFPLGGMGVSGLRREAGRGNLRIYKMANKDFTTLRDINGMREKCRATPNQPASGLNPKREMQREGSQGERDDPASKGFETRHHRQAPQDGHRSRRPSRA